MKPDDLERRLRNGSWPELRPELKSRLMHRARRRVAARRRGPLFRWALAAAAALLIAINLIGERAHTRRMDAITGGATIGRPIAPGVYAEARRYRVELLSEITGHLGNS
ncbi:MAG: hypothetical protein PVH68_11115 [Armatimonadota bacterium]|jgi:hypothetical protein